MNFFPISTDAAAMFPEAVQVIDGEYPKYKRYRIHDTPLPPGNYEFFFNVTSTSKCKTEMDVSCFSVVIATFNDSACFDYGGIH